MQPLASIPSPSSGVWHLGFIPLRGYALAIILGVVVAVWLGERRWTQRGGAAGTVVDVAVWAVPFGLVGGRLYHVITDSQLYFGSGRNPVDALKIWHGGLGIWGAIALGGLGAYLGCRRRGVSFLALADAAAPGIALAQAIGRWGNWFNQELYGKPLNAPWAVEIDFDHRPKDSLGNVLEQYRDVSTYHPTFLYESLWCVGVAVFVIWAGKRFQLTHGRTFALYVAAYTVGRAWIEALRIDTAHHVLGLRLNDWTSLILFVAAVAYLYVNRDKGEAAQVAAADAGGAPAGPAAEEAGSDRDTDTDTAGTAPEETAPSTSASGGTGGTGAEDKETKTPEQAEATAPDDEPDDEPGDEPGDEPEDGRPEPATAGKPGSDAGDAGREKTE
ncbi:MAG TPA: prolipoprotein diacylglyceryl transferase [Streptosporangiaceae bacterium]|nr:prolipoprotein diacylglyceryl transferase [Streptosporangiaceae bacterium]